MNMVISELEQLQQAYSLILSSEQDNLTRQLQEYTEALNDIRSRYSSLPATLPRPVTIPVIFHRPYDENFISDYLAYVLDPNRNGLGISPIQSLLQLAFPDFGEIDPSEVSVIREFDTGAGRIDLLIQVDDIFVLGIENKIGSPEGKGQTARYNRRLRELFKDQIRYLIYLTPTGQKPRSKAFLPISYRQMLSAFRLIRYDWRSDIHNSVIWEDFLTHLEAYIVMDSSDFEFSPRALLYIENLSMMTDLQKAFKDDWDALLSYLEARLLEHLEPGIWDTNFNRRNSWYQFYKKSWSYPGLFLHYEYGMSPAGLVAGSFVLAFHAEGKLSPEFVDLFMKKFPDLKERYEKLSIEFLPAQYGKWQAEHAVARKKYALEPPLSNLAEQWINAFDEFSFLTEVIDSLLEEYKNTQV